VLYFDLTNIGKCKRIFLKSVKKVNECCQQFFLGGGWALGCGCAKLNVMFLYRLMRWQNTSFNFAKRWYFSVRLLSLVSVF
jgi:hypothetical protein